MAKDVVAQLRASKSKILGVIKNNTNNKKDSYYRRSYNGYYGKYKSTGYYHHRADSKSTAEDKK